MVKPLPPGSPGQAQFKPGARPEAKGSSQEPIASETPRPAKALSFDQRVYGLVARIPAGRLATYGQIAELLGAYGSARQVGWALRRLPLPSPVPWQRVVNAQGRISMDPSRQGSDWIQRELLLAEGIAVAADGRLPLAAHRWQPAAPGALEGPLGR
jgi:methylated-DNA-protein-cysteine methyltransferase-like protein